LKKKIRLLLIVISIVFSSKVFAQGTLDGRVIFKGEPPPVENIEVKSDVQTCGTVKEVNPLILGKEQGVANAVVTVVGASGKANIETGKLDQIDCEFVPHVQILPVGSTLNITSSDPVLHNSHGLFEDSSTSFNLAVPFAGIEIPQVLDKAGIIKLRCDAGHTWMSAYIYVTDRPFYALTGENGEFSIANLPPGEYEIEVWHEWLGVHREKVSVKEGEQAVQIIMEKSKSLVLPEKTD
jgi:hypothetical protein